MDAMSSSGREPTDPPVHLDIRGFTLGPFATNCYLVRPRGYEGCWVIDASFSPAPLIQAIRQWVGPGGRPELLVLTHAHVDHIAGVDQVLAEFPRTPVVIHEAERAWPGDAQANLSALSGMAVTCHGPDRTVKDGDELALGPSRWRVLHTPGHSPGGMCLLALNAHRPLVIAGDALFAGSIGRTDLPGGDHQTLLASIREKLYTLDPATMVLAGHGPQTTIGAERLSNPYVRA